MAARPVPGTTGVAKEVERAVGVAWDSLKEHANSCQICPNAVAGDLCTIGDLLRHQWFEIHELMHEPSRWALVQVAS